LARDGRTIPVSLMIAPIRDEGGRIVGSSKVVRDLRDAQRMGIGAVLEQRESLIHASRMDELGQMAAALAHEVDQPLTAITNYARGAGRLIKAEASPALHDAIAKIAEQAARARAIVQSVRGMVKKETRSFQAEDLKHIVEQTSVLALLGSGQSVALVLKLDPSAKLVDIDRIQIQQVLLNLMRNAVQAMEDCPLRQLTVATVRQGDRVAVSVSDTGPGLAESVRTRLFQPFVTTKADGLGIGLSICRTIVQSHGGELRAETVPSGGTAFSFTIPALNEAVH
jgi:two-component system, LuxR family, sensor kinase FixL